LRAALAVVEQHLDVLFAERDLPAAPLRAAKAADCQALLDQVEGLTDLLARYAVTLTTPSPEVGCFPARRTVVTVLCMVNLGTVPGDPDEILVSTTDPDKVTVWLGAAGATDLTRKDAEELAALLLRAVRQLGG